MKVPKSANPYGVSISQVWKRKRKDRPSKFVIKEFEKEKDFEKESDGFFAVVQYGKGSKAFTRKINLTNFGDCQLVK